MNAVTKPEPQPRGRILFVDDSRMMRMCANKILGQTFDLVVAESAEQAWEILGKDEHIQILFTDLQMPGKSGFELLEQIRKSESSRLADLPVVLVTGSEDCEEMRERALEKGATDFLTKPFQASELMARAKSHVNSGRSRQQLRDLQRDHHLDQATGLGNRSYCEQRLAQAISFAARHDQSLTLMHLQLSGLEMLLNDLGEPFAKRALGRIGEKLAQSVRNEDTVFRSGSESFTFLLPATEPRGAETLQERFLPNLDRLGLAGNDHSLEVSCHFLIQPVPVDGRFGAARILEDGLSGTITSPDTATDQSEPVQNEPATPGLEEALQMIKRGEGERLRPHLPKLREHLEPLLALLR